MVKRASKYLILYVLFFSTICHGYERIIPMAPSLVETIYALGKGDCVAAIPMFTTYPEEALKKPLVGSYLSPSYEQILKISPDLIIIQGEFIKLRNFSRKYNFPILDVNMDSIETIYSGIIKIGKKLECSEDAKKLVNKIKKGIRSGSDFKFNPKIFICIGRTPGSLRQIYTAGNKSFISELIKLSGGKNIFSDIDKNYLMVSKEEILKRNPDIIIDVIPGVDSKNDIIKELWKKIGPLKAVKKDRIFVLNENYILIPGPRIVNTSLLFKKIIKEAYLE